MITRSSIALLFGSGLVCLMMLGSGCLTESPVAKPSAKPATDHAAKPAAAANNPLGPNAACYVCHMTYVKEPMSRLHLKHKVYCIDCHGPSIGHANDEDIGATKPDKYFKRGQVNASCRKCHSDHDAKPELVIKRYIDRKLTTDSPVCTDCHGQHRIKREKDAKPAAR